MSDEVRQSAEIEHAKKLVRENKKKAKLPKKEKQFFTVKDGKVLSIKVKPSGAYSTYIGTKKKWDKKDKNGYSVTVAKWKSDGLWVSEEDYNEKCSKIIEELNK